MSITNLQHFAVMGVLLAGCCLQSANAQYPVKIHSHNDYTRTVPFYQAYAQKIYSIEVDMFYRDGQFYVCHDEKDIADGRTFEQLYLQPILSLYKQNNGQAWADEARPLQLLIEIKSDNTSAFMDALTRLFEEHPSVFNPSVNPNAVRVTITGRVPPPDEFARYPEYICFDGDLNQNYTARQLERVALFSVDFQSLSKWNGKGLPVASERVRIAEVVSRAHAAGKPVRFWGAPDGITAWNLFQSMGIDYINTDRVERCADFFSNWHNKTYVIGGDASASATGVTRTDRLDKTTHDFAGFRNDKLQLAERIPLYTPSYRNDGADLPVKNVILLIGDGMGLAQITAADRVNNGLNMLLLKHLGLITTSSRDAFTTDSAGAGSALATGEQNSNRHIAMSDDGKPYPQLTDFFKEAGKDCGVVTLGNVADATPAAFYGHNVERDNAEDLTRELLNGKLSVLAGSGMECFVRRKDGLDLRNELKQRGYRFVTQADEIDADTAKVICIDEEMAKATDTDNFDLLANATRRSIELLNGRNPKGFFLMVEGAKVDYAGHSNCFPASVVETLGFDRAVAEALKFADRDGKTLVIVTGDHETGGLTLIDGDNQTGRMTACYVTDDHTPIMLPVFSYGPQADKFGGKYYNYDIPRRIKTLPIE